MDPKKIEDLISWYIGGIINSLEDASDDVASFCDRTSKTDVVIEAIKKHMTEITYQYTAIMALAEMWRREKGRYEN